MPEPRAWTPEEVRAQFIERVDAIAEHWRTTATDHDRCRGVAFSILTLLDGCTPDFPAVGLTIESAPGDKAYYQGLGKNWYEPGQRFGQCELHAEFSVDRLRRSG